VLIMMNVRMCFLSITGNGTTSGTTSSNFGQKLNFLKVLEMKWNAVNVLRMFFFNCESFWDRVKKPLRIFLKFGTTLLFIYYMTGAEIYWVYWVNGFTSSYSFTIRNFNIGFTKMISLKVGRLISGLVSPFILLKSIWERIRTGD